MASVKKGVFEVDTQAERSVTTLPYYCDMSVYFAGIFTLI